MFKMNSFKKRTIALLTAAAAPLFTLPNTACAEANSADYEPFVNLSYHYYSANVAEKDITAIIDDTQGHGYSVTAGIRNHYGKHRLGTAIEYTDIFTRYMVGFRALDYTYQTSDNWMWGAFFGAASLNSGLPQNGYYMGASASALQLMAGFDLTLELRYASGLARDRELDTDLPGGGKPDIFLDTTVLAIGMTKRF